MKSRGSVRGYLLRHRARLVLGLFFVLCGNIFALLSPVVLQRASGSATGVAPLASAFDTAYWWSVGIAALALIPCVVLLRAENPRARPSRAAKDAESAIEPLGA